MTVFGLWRMVSLRRGIYNATADELGFSARAYDKVLRVARTLADLEAVDDIAVPHIAEAIQYRSLDGQLF